MKKQVWLVVGVGLIFLAFGLGVLLVVGWGDGASGLVSQIPLPFGMGELVLPINDKQLSTNKTPFDDAERPQTTFAQPVTTFVPSTALTAGGMVVSRGFGQDGIERALLRGKITSLTAKYLEMVVASQSFKVYFPRVFEQVCIPSTITDTKGVTFETTKGFIDLTTYREGVEERGMKEVGEILKAGDETLVLARYKNGDFVAITVAGYGCVR